MPSYKVTFSDVSIKEMYVESTSSDQVWTDFKTLTPEMEINIENAVEVDGYYDNDIFIQEVIEHSEI